MGHGGWVRLVWAAAFLGATAGAALAQSEAEGAQVTPSTGGASEDLEALLSEEVGPGTTGSFGRRLTQYGIDLYTHSYVTVDYVYRQTGAPNTFDLHYFNLFVGANIQNVIVPEMQIEYEHGGDDISIRFAQVDIHLHDLLTIRLGQFLTPFGRYNEYLYPEFLSKTPRQPLLNFMGHVIPAAWSSVGVQVRGALKLGEEREINYALYVVNGLEQKNTSTTTLASEGGDLRLMRKTTRDRNNGHKSIGGRIGARLVPGLEVGGSVYYGSYTEDGSQEVTLYGVDATYTAGPLSLGLETAYVHQERRTGHDLHKRGLYSWVAYRFENVLGDIWSLDVEPVVALDWQHLGLGRDLGEAGRQQNIRGFLFGVNLYPFAQTLPNLNWRLFYAHYDNDGKELRDDTFMTQLTLGF